MGEHSGAVARLRPLARSLGPLPGESLGGYLLRLACRLRLAPLPLARMSGCVGPASPSLRRKLLVAPPSDQFARTTGLTREEARSLMLLDWAPRYPPIAATLSHALGRSDSWLFNGMPRFCPRCLAGDASTIQRQYGGTWKREWHLPVSFACPDHKTLLLDGCVREHPPSDGDQLLIRQGADAALHPVQCRHPDPDAARRRGRLHASCGTRLDHLPVTPPAALTPDILATQRRILDHLASGGTGETATCYFTDLRVITTFLRAVWPRSRDLIDPARHGAVDGDARDFGSWSDRSSGFRSLDQPPLSVNASAALLTAATAVLDDPARQAALAQHIRASRNRLSGAEPWADVFTQQVVKCSPALRHVFEPLTYTSWRTGCSGRTGPTSDVGYQPEHIPAFLENNWYTQHLAPLLGGHRATIARRFAAATLVQRAAGSSIDEAARYLGFASTSPYAPSSTLYKWLVEPGLDRFDRALHDLAQRLDDATDLINYRRRRHILRNWSLTTGEWDEITSALAPRHLRLFVLDDHKRQEASAVIWAHITQGEPRCAPRPLEAVQPQQSRIAWRASRPNTLFQLTRPYTGPGYAALQALLAQHADRLAEQIDNGVLPDY